MTARTLVIGGGLAGLLAARRHARAGCEVTLLEAEDRLGGAIRTAMLERVPVELGAEAYATASPAVDELLTELGLESATQSPTPELSSRLVSAAGVHRAPTRSLLGIPARPWSREVRSVIGPWGSLRAGIDRLLPARIGAGDHVSIADCVRTRMGSRVLDRLVAPLIGGVHSADPASLELATASPSLLPALARTGSLSGAVTAVRGASGRSPGTAVRTLTAGMSALTDALAADTLARDGRLLPDSPVTALRRTGTGSWRATVDHDRSYDAEQIVLACPPDVARRLLTDPAPAIAAAIPDAPATPVRLAVLLLDAPELDGSPCGTGALVAPGTPGVRAKALTHASAKWQHVRAAAAPHHVVRLSYGRPGEQLPDAADLPELALADASTVLGVPLDRSRLVASHVVTWSDAMRQRGPGHAEALQHLEQILPEQPSLELCGSWRSGTGIAALVRADSAAATPTGAADDAPPLVPTTEGHRA